MPKPPRDVTDAELAVLQVLWDAGSATIREITDGLYPGGATSHYATVQKLLERLEVKQCVRRERRSVPHVFAPIVARDELIGLRLQEVADQLCEGSLAPLLTRLVHGRRLSEEERQAMRRLVDRLDQQRPRRKKEER